MPVCQRVKRITPFLVMDVLERAQQLEREGRRIIHLEIGEPDLDTPECVKAACAKALAEGETHYTHSLGIIELREAVCEHYEKRYGVHIHPDQVLVTSGTSPAMLMLFSALLKDGDKVALSDPAYACYPNVIQFAGAEPLRIPTPEEDGFQFRASAIRDRMDPKTRAVVINSPGNPTGTLLASERMRRISDLGLHVISDEIYHGLVYEGRERSMLEFRDDAFVLNGFSKLYAMTGFRLGYLIMPPRYTRPLQCMAQNFFISANTMAQRAGVAALREAGPDVTRMRSIYDERRLTLIRGLERIGLPPASRPTGAFYVMVNASRLDKDSQRLAFDILNTAGVALTPGVDFGPGGEGYLRLSYANSIENIEEGLERLGSYLEQRTDA
jgi:aspartate/methionine/tyrosine aminotransferase